MTAAILVGIAGGIGAVLRWSATRLLPVEGSFPVAITTVNVVGAFLLGLVVGADSATVVGLDREVVTVGLLGGLTTFSTWMVDIDQQPTRPHRLLVAGVPLVAGVIAATLGIAIAS